MPDSEDLGFTKLFDSPAQPAQSWEAISEAERKEMEAGAAELTTTGYYLSTARKAPKVAPSQEDGRYCILCIDDETVLLGLLAKKLTLDGYAVRTAFDRPTIVAELQRPPLPDLILLDVGLPGFSGFDLLQNLRRHPKIRSVPVIMLTARAGPRDLLLGMANGADGYVSKPFQFQALAAAMETILGIR